MTFHRTILSLSFIACLLAGCATDQLPKVDQYEMAREAAAEILVACSFPTTRKRGWSRSNLAVWDLV